MHLKLNVDSLTLSNNLEFIIIPKTKILYLDVDDLYSLFNKYDLSEDTIISILDWCLL